MLGMSYLKWGVPGLFVLDTRGLVDKKVEKCDTLCDILVEKCHMLRGHFG